MYGVYKRIEDGALVHVSSPESLEYATHLVQELYADWPGEYVVRDSEGNNVRFLKGQQFVHAAPLTGALSFGPERPNSRRRTNPAI